VVDFRTRTVLRVLLIVLCVAVTLEIVWIARHVLAWVVIALFLALALNPLVSWIQRRTHLARGPAIGVAYLIVLIAIVAIGATFLPKLIDEVNGFVQALPNYVHDLTHGRGRLGFLERKYHVVEKVRQQVQNGGAKKVLGLSGAALSVTKSIISLIAATVTIVFLTFFMLLEGGGWMERIYSLFPDHSQARVRRVGEDIYKTVGGYVTGNILISVIAGASATIVLLIMGVPYAVALGLLVAVLDLIPLAGATVAGVVVSLVAFLHSVPAGIVVVIFVIVYQQLENHFLQPVIYGRTVQLSALAVLVSVLVGAELAGILGALAAIPVAGTLQVLIRDQLSARRGPLAQPALAAGPEPPG
jgi:predicted PurR-regulated permease PerM